jgi:WD40 repeat protein
MKAGRLCGVLLLVPGIGLSEGLAQSHASAPDADASAPELVVQTGHSVPVHWTRFSPSVAWSTVGVPDRPGNGEIIATGSNDGTVKIWDTRELREVRVLRLGNGASIGAMAISRDGAKVAAVGGDLAKVWEIGTGREVFTVRLSAASGSSDPVLAKSIAFNQDGTRLAVGDDKHAEVWAIDGSGNPLLVTSLAEKIAFGPGDVLAVVGHDPIPPGKSVDLSIPYRITVWDTRTRSSLGSYAGVGYYVFSVAVNEDGSVLSWGGGCMPRQPCGSTVRRIARDGSIRDSNGPPLHPTGGTFCPETGMLAVGTSDGHVMLWDVAEEKSVYQGTTDKSFIEDVSCSHDGQRLVSGESRGRVTLWDRKQPAPIRVLEGFANEIDGFAADPSSRNLMFLGRGTNFQYGYTETLLRWDTGSVKAPEYVPNSSAPLIESEDGRWIAVGKNKQSVVLVDDKGAVLDTGISAPGAAVAFDPVGEQFAASQDGAITLWSTHPWTRRGRVARWTNLLLETVAFSRDGKTLASAGGEGAVMLWDLPGMRRRCVLGEIRDPTHTTWSVAFSPDRKTLASAGNDQMIQLWNVESCALVGSLAGHEGPIHQIVYSSDGKLIASAGWDGTTCLWDVEKRIVKYIFRGHGWLVESVAFIDHDRIVVSGGQDGTARLWEVASGKELATVVTFRDGVNWLIATPEGYFDSTASAAEKIFWRIGETNDLVPLSRFYTDFYRPGLLTELLQGKRPVPVIDVATSLGIPSLRTMLSSDADLAHIEHRGNTTLICLSVPPGASMGVDIADENLLKQRQELKVVPDDPTCKNQIDLGRLGEEYRASRQRSAPTFPDAMGWRGL